MRRSFSLGTPTRTAVRKVNDGARRGPRAGSDGPRAIAVQNPNAALKLAPAAKLPEAWMQTAEFEWIGNRGECRQQMVWFRDLARHPGRRTATVFTAGLIEPRTIHGDARLEIPAAELGTLCFEPHAAVLAADLTGMLPVSGLQCVSPGIADFTGDRTLADPTLACFEATEILPLDPKYCGTRFGNGRSATWKSRNAASRLDPDEVRKQLHLRGDHSAALLITPVKKKIVAILAQRIGSVPDHEPADSETDAAE